MSPNAKLLDEFTFFSNEMLDELDYEKINLNLNVDNNDNHDKSDINLLGCTVTNRKAMLRVANSETSKVQLNTATNNEVRLYMNYLNQNGINFVLI